MTAFDVSDEKFQTLRMLGLTVNQARVYLALLGLKESSAKAISEVAGLAACDVYRVLPELQKIGLIDTLVTTPKQFVAVPPESSVQILAMRKKLENDNLQSKAANLIRGFREQHLQQPQKAEIALITGGKRLKEFGAPKLLNIKTELRAIQTNALFRDFVYNTSDSLKKLLEKGVEIRFVIENKSGIKNPSDELKGLLENNNFRVRFAKRKILSCIFLNDNTGAFIGASLDPIHDPSYWSNNPCVIEVVNTYFETLWRESS